MLCSLGVWAVVFMTLSKGIKSSGKVSLKQPSEKYRFVNLNYNDNRYKKQTNTQHTMIYKMYTDSEIIE